MRLLRTAAVAALAVLASAPRPDAQGLPFSLFERYLESLREQTGIPAVSAVIVQSGNIVWRAGLGKQDVERSIAARDDTPYPIGDLTETFAAVLVGRCVENLGLSINQHMPAGLSPIPFANLIYFGAGDTDVPSIAVMRKYGGPAVAVYPPGKSKATCVDLFSAGRCDFFAAADYRSGSDLFRRTCLLLDRMLAHIRVEEERWRLGRGLGSGK